MTRGDVIFSELAGQRGNVGEIILNRPRALNALTADMCQRISDQLKHWQENDGIKAVIIKGAGDHAFCAGGDVLSLHDFRDKPDAAMEFFRHEYLMNCRIFHFTKPYISLLDGITMGGGAGVSVHGSHRIATENFLFSMPETAIGFFPDIGAAHFLNRCPMRMGDYLGLTGEKIAAVDAILLGIATNYVPQCHLQNIVSDVCATPFGDNPVLKVSEIIASYQKELPESQLVQDQVVISDCFSQVTVEKIIEALDVVDSPWAEHTLKTLITRSPTSLKVTLAHLRRAKSLEFDEIMQMDFTVAYHFMRTDDFFEGVRAALIDKDQSPAWNPVSISEISAADVEGFFTDDVTLPIESSP